MPFYYSVSWSEANKIRRELDVRLIPFELATQSSRDVVFLFPDLPPRLYECIGETFNSNGKPI